MKMEYSGCGMDASLDECGGEDPLTDWYAMAMCGAVNREHRWKESTYLQRAPPVGVLYVICMERRQRALCCAGITVYGPANR